MFILYGETRSTLEVELEKWEPQLKCLSLLRETEV